MQAADVIQEREKTHGDFTETARLAQATKNVWRCGSNWNRLSFRQQEALDLVATKVARILSGDPDCRDHWLDLGGYLKLGGE